MPESPTQRIPTETMQHLVRSSGPQPSPRAQLLHVPVFVAFGVWAVIACGMMLLRLDLPSAWGWLDGLIFVFAAATNLVWIARRLPAQNVAACGFIVAAVSAVVATVGAKTHFPFGEFEFTEHFGPKIVGLLAWPVPFIWLAVLLSSRGVAKLILRPWRRGRQYGYGLIGLAAALVLVVDFALEPLAVQAGGYWTFRASALPVDWYGAPWYNFLSCWVLAAVILAFASPWFIVKRAVPQPTDYHPLIVWLALNFFLTTGNAAHGSWAAVAFAALACVPVAFFAWRNGRKQPPPEAATSARGGAK